MDINVWQLIVIVFIAWAAYAIIGLIAMEETLKKVIFIIISIIVFLAILQSLGVYNSGTHLNLNTHN